jgi:hypothetical protein
MKTRTRQKQQRENTPLLPLMKQSPYLFFSCPFTYSSVCSIAMFMKPSSPANTPVNAQQRQHNHTFKRNSGEFGRNGGVHIAKPNTTTLTSVLYTRIELDEDRSPSN